MKHSFIFALSTIVQPGRLKKNTNLETRLLKYRYVCFFSVPNGYCTHQQMANTIVAASLLGSQKLPAMLAKLATLTASNCWMDGLKMASKHSTNWPKKFTKTARSMVRNSTRPTRKPWKKKWPAPTKLAKGKDTTLTLTMIWTKENLSRRMQIAVMKMRRKTSNGWQKMCSLSRN